MHYSALGMRAQRAAEARQVDEAKRAEDAKQADSAKQGEDADPSSAELAAPEQLVQQLLRVKRDRRRALITGVITDLLDGVRAAGKRPAMPSVKNSGAFGSAP